MACGPTVVDHGVYLFDLYRRELVYAITGPEQRSSGFGVNGMRSRCGGVWIVFK